MGKVTFSRSARERGCRGPRAGGFALTRQEAAGKESVPRLIPWSAIGGPSDLPSVPQLSLWPTSGTARG
jgi:hypothetical protein